MPRTTALLLLAVLTACGGPAVRPSGTGTGTEDFRGGTCLVLAEDLVLLRGFAAQDLLDHPQQPPVEPADTRLLLDLTARFRQGLAQESGALVAPLTALVGAVEDLSAGLADGSYAGPGPLTRVRDAADGLIRACT